MLGMSVGGFFEVVKTKLKTKGNLKHPIISRSTLRVGPQGRRLDYGHLKQNG